MKLKIDHFKDLFLDILRHPYFCIIDISSLKNYLQTLLVMIN